RVYSNDESHNGPNTNPQKRGQRGTWPNTTNPLISGGGDVTGYQAGSSFKVFTLVAALEQNVPLNHTINAISPYVSNYIIDPHSPAACNGDHYCPVNANPPWMNGPRNMWTGLGRSVNTYWVPLEWEIGAENAVSAARQLGIQFRASNDARLAANAHQWGAFTLGVSATTPLDMANAYATLGADGLYCEPLPVIEIRDFTGHSVDAATPTRRWSTRPWPGRCTTRWWASRRSASRRHRRRSPSDRAASRASRTRPRHRRPVRHRRGRSRRHRPRNRATAVRRAGSPAVF